MLNISKRELIVQNIKPSAVKVTIKFNPVNSNLFSVNVMSTPQLDSEMYLPGDDLALI